MSVLYTILGIVVVLVIWGVFAYNSLVQQKNWVKEAWAQIDVQNKSLLCEMKFQHNKNWMHLTNYQVL